MPEQDRPREKLATHGARTERQRADRDFAPHRYAWRERRGRRARTSRRDTSLGGLSRCRVEELAKIKGIGFAKAVQLAAAFGLGSRLARENSCANLKSIRRSSFTNCSRPTCARCTRNRCASFCWTRKYHLLRVEESLIGSLNESIAHPREIFRPALIYSAFAVIVAHNHPSGDPVAERSGSPAHAPARRGCQLLQIRYSTTSSSARRLTRAPYFSFKEAGVTYEKKSPHLAS